MTCTVVSRGCILLPHVADLAFSDHNPNYTSTVIMLGTILRHDNIFILCI